MARLLAWLLPTVSVAASSRPLATPPPLDFHALASELVSSTPPELPAGVGSRAHVEAMVNDAIAWCALNGLLVQFPMPPETSVTEASPPLVTHAPFSLLPAAYPASALEHAKRLAPLFGALVEAVGRNVPWLARTLKEAADGDEYTRRLLKLCAQVQREGATQPARLAILRSDYMLHEPEGASSASLLQVELNTVASSFGALAARVGSLHAVLAQRWAGARQHAWLAAGQPKVLSLEETLPPSKAVQQLAGALAAAHGEYGVQGAVVLFVVQPDETNTIDQELLAQQLWAAHGVRSVRRTLAELAYEARLHGKERRLLLPSPSTEVAVVYFRAGYTPEDYPSQRHWDARTLLERSHAIKCPVSRTKRLHLIALDCT